MAIFLAEHLEGFDLCCSQCLCFDHNNGLLPFSSRSDASGIVSNLETPLIDESLQNIDETLPQTNLNGEVFSQKQNDGEVCLISQDANLPFFHVQHGSESFADDTDSAADNSLDTRPNISNTLKNIPLIKLEPLTNDQHYFDDAIESKSYQGDGKPKRLKCSICSKTFCDKATLQRHKRIHTGVKCHPCTICGKLFSRADHLKMHTYTHSEIKPWKCDVCNKQFVQKHSLKVHKCQNRLTSIEPSQSRLTSIEPN